MVEAHCLASVKGKGALTATYSEAVFMQKKSLENKVYGQNMIEWLQQICLVGLTSISNI